MLIAASIYVVWFVYTSAFVGLTALLAKTCGVSLKAVKIGFGPAIIRQRQQALDFSLHLLPFSGSVAFNDPTVPPGEDTTGSPLHFLSIGQQIAIALAGPLADAALGLALLFTQQGAPLVISGLLGLYLALFNLLPLPALNGFTILMAMIPSLRNRTVAAIVPSWTILVSVLIGLISQGYFIYLALTNPQVLVNIGRVIVTALIG